MSATLSNSGGALHISSGSTTTAIEQGIAKAWVNFDGTGTAAISDSYNTSSLTDKGTGHYWVYWTDTFTNADYCYTASGRSEGQAIDASGASTSTLVAYISVNGGGSLVDNSTNCIVCHGDLA